LADSLSLYIDLEGNAARSVDEYLMSHEAQLAADLWQLPVLTACRLIIENGEGDQLSTTEETLSSCRTFALSRNNKRQLMHIDALLALLCKIRGDRQQALDNLTMAVLRGEPGGALRYFVDLGPELIPLLRTLREQGTAPVYIQNILNAYNEPELMENVSPTGEANGTLSPEAVFIMGELTNREIEVLRLLGKRLTNKEIAQQMHVSPNTIKKYSVSVYNKLEVGNRRQAVARAVELGIIPRP
jgi:LuxR family maltose regulon positive regulatory protein